MSLMNRSFLLSKSIPLPSKSNVKNFYDQDLDINYVSESDRTVPTVMLGGALTTQSKTFAAPGDDDPDREGESCY